MFGRIGQRGNGVEQFVDVVDAQHARAPERRVVNRVRPGERARVRRGGLRRFHMAARLDDDDGFQTCGGARRRHEFPRMRDRFDIEQDRARAPVQRQPVQHVAEIDVGHRAERDHVRKADLARVRPIEHGGRHRARLGDEGEIALGGRKMREGGVEPRAGHQDAQAIRPDDPHEMGLGGIEHRLFQRLALAARQFAEPCRQHHRRLATARRQFADHARYDLGRRAYDGEIGCCRQRRHVGIGVDALDRFVFRVHRQDRTLESAGEQIARKHVADRPRLRRRADQCHGFRGEHVVEIADRHTGSSRYAASQHNPSAAVSGV